MLVRGIHLQTKRQLVASVEPTLAGNNKPFIDVWVGNSILVGRMREQEMAAGDWLRMEVVVKCVQEVDGGEVPAVLSFILEN